MQRVSGLTMNPSGDIDTSSTIFAFGGHSDAQDLLSLGLAAAARSVRAFP
jgi:hypothetical protein